MTMTAKRLDELLAEARQGLAETAELAKRAIGLALVQGQRDGYAEALWDYRPDPHRVRGTPEEMRERERYQKAALEKYP